VGGPGQRLGLAVADQVGAGHPAHQQRPAAEQGQRPVAVQQQVRQVLGGVPGGGHGAQHQPAQVDPLVVLQAAVEVAQPAGPWGQDLGAGGGQLPAPGQEVGMQVGLERVGDRQPEAFGDGQVGARVPGRVDHQGPPVSQLDHIGAVAEPLVDHRVDAHRGRTGGRLLVTA
jgi:hypothetical protein